MQYFPYLLQEMCSVCYKQNKYSDFKDDKCVSCQLRNINPVYVNPKAYKDFVRDFWNRGVGNNQSTVMMCNHENVTNKYIHATTNKGCTFASSEFEFFIWTWMKNKQMYTISDIFKEFVAPFVFKDSHNVKKIVLRKSITTQLLSLKNNVRNIPFSREENFTFQAEEKKKIYFCWFCLKNITSEHDIEVHINGSDHKLLYAADTKRQWFFKMPNSKSVSVCAKKKCDCNSPHSEDEFQEMIGRIKFRNFTFTDSNLSEQKVHSWPKKIEFIFRSFPNNFQSYSKSLRTTVKLILNRCTVKYICLRDQASMPFFKLLDNRNIQKGQILLFDTYTKDDFADFNFDIEFFPTFNGTYKICLEFCFLYKEMEYISRKCIRVDVGTTHHLQQFKENWNRFHKLLNGEIKYDHIIPFSNDIEVTNSIVTEDLLNRVFRVTCNLNWRENSLQPWNYCNWMRDMTVYEELEQQLLLSKFKFTGDMKVKNHFQKSSFIHAKNGCLFGTITFNNKLHDSFTREYIFKNINKVFIYSKDDNNIGTLFECDIVDYFKYQVESRSLNEVTLYIPQIAVNKLDLKQDSVAKQITILFRFNRLVFERRHNSLDRIPHYDSLYYNPLCCPTFTRLPYGESQSAISFTPKLILNKEQAKLPKLVLRKLKKDEIALPFALNGAFGTGKTSVIVETVSAILKVFIERYRILICTRSVSALKVYLTMFKKSLSEKMMKKVNLISDKTGLNVNTDLGIIQNSSVTLDLLKKGEVFVATLDMALASMSPLVCNFNDDDPMFHFIFVDEASQVLEVDAISVYQFGNKKSKFVFAGDLFQLRPDYYNQSLRKFSVPIVSRLHNMYIKCSDYEICLKQIYRSHPLLVQYLNNAIYKNCGLTPAIEPLYPPIFPMKFIDSNKDGQNQEEYDELYCSHINVNEAAIILNEIETLLKGDSEIKMLAKDILVCTPFYSQKKLIQGLLQNEDIFCSIHLPSGIQGEEYDAVFISTVLTVNNDYQHKIFHPTFHNTRGLVNLAISRAKHCVTVVGDKECLLSHECHIQWEMFCNMCDSKR